MDASDIVTSSPERLSLGRPGHDYEYELAQDLVAVHGSKGGRSAVLAFESDLVSVHHLDGVTGLTGKERFGPVYRRIPGGGIAVPTGRILVRFGESDRAEDHRAALARAEYVVETVHSYAPQAAWVRARAEGISDALRGLPRLERLPDVEAVEPQMLSEATARR
jgi:hypothetical protein